MARHLGQHFLRDDSVVQQILDVISLRATDHVVEVGPGRGALTIGIAAATHNLTLIELDRKLADSLRKRFPDVTILVEDAVRTTAETYSHRRVVGNLPYEISSPLLIKLLQLDVVDMTFMMQKEVVDRVVAQPGTKAYGRLSVLTQYQWQPSYCFDVPPDAFDPPPKVESSIVQITPKSSNEEQISFAELATVLQVAFNQRRKTLRNSLKRFNVDWMSTGIEPSQRADATSIPEYVALAQHIAEAGPFDSSSSQIA